MWLEKLFEVVYPTRCAGCDFPGTLLCDRCREAIRAIRPAHACRSCGVPFGEIVCTECWNSEFAFSEAMCAGSLVRPLSRLVTIYKDGGERRLAPVMASVLAEVLEPWRDWTQAVVPVPSSPASISLRGFHHIAFVADGLAQMWEVPAISALHSVARSDQRLLGRQARQRNVSATMSTVRKISLPLRVLLLDDVITTGATVDAAAAELLAHGAGEVRVGALARAW